MNLMYLGDAVDIRGSINHFAKYSERKVVNERSESHYWNTVLRNQQNRQSVPTVVYMNILFCKCNVIKSLYYL